MQWAQTLWVIVLLLGVASAGPVKAESGSKAEGAWYVGESARSCGEFLNASDAERKARPANAAAPSAIYTAQFVAFVAIVDAYLTASNLWDANAHMVGKSSEVWGRMAWVEQWCRNNPTEMFVRAAIALRVYLKDHNE